MFRDDYSASSHETDPRRRSRTRTNRDRHSASMTIAIPSLPQLLAHVAQAVRVRLAHLRRVR